MFYEQCVGDLYLCNKLEALQSPKRISTDILYTFSLDKWSRPARRSLTSLKYCERSFSALIT